MILQDQRKLYIKDYIDEGVSSTMEIYVCIYTNESEKREEQEEEIMPRIRGERGKHGEGKEEKKKVEVVELVGWWS